MALRLRLGSTLLVAAMGVVLPILDPARAAAAPCSVAPVGPQARMPQQMQPRLPIPHLPVGRQPAPPGTVSTPDSAVMTPSAALLPDAAGRPVQNPAVSYEVAPGTLAPDAVAIPGAAAPPAAAAAAPVVPEARVVSWVTGPDTDSYRRFGISGADLGIMWDNGQSGAANQVLIAFGDTFGNCNVPGQEWRSNTLFRSADRNLADGMSVPDPVVGDIYAGSPVTAARPNFAKQVIDSLHLVGNEVTVIPTAAIAVGTTQYINFMSVSGWGAPGSWSTNFSAIAVSTDNGETWTVPRSSIRPSMFFAVPWVFFVWGEQNFQQGAFVRRGGYVYFFGTTPGRGGAAFVSRVPENAITDRWSYEYYTPFGWIRGMTFLAVQVIWDRTSELSVAWNDHLNKFVILYTNTFNNVVMRTADKPEGPWSSPTTLVTAKTVPGGMYAPYIHPWSSGRDLYFTLSQWSDYSVALMHTTLP